MNSIIFVRMAYRGIERSIAHSYDSMDWLAFIKVMPIDCFLKISAISIGK